MIRRSSRSLLTALFGTLVLCTPLCLAGPEATPTEVPPDALKAWPGEELSGGDTTVFDDQHGAFGRALNNLDPKRWMTMRAGKRLFDNPWKPPTADASSTLRRGLGPLHNATACSDCHFHDGRGGPPQERSSTGRIVGPPTPAPLLARLSVPGLGPDPSYGGQFNDRGIGVPAEGRLVVDYEETVGAFLDGQEYRLRRPRTSLEALSQGPTHTSLQTSLRIPPTLIGLGLLERVPATQLEALADPEDRDGDGISGRVQRISDATGTTTVGRFGWKAGQPDLETQVATAFHEDMGVTSPLHPLPNCPPKDKACLNGSPEVELSQTQLDRVVLYTRLLAPPGRRDWQDQEVLQGRDTFLSVGCASCHQPELQTGASDGEPGSIDELAGQTIRPFTDLLLHDMGPELQDGVAEHAASPSEWRTAPLWGLGLMERVNGHVRLLHDGRAHSVEEAILWHGGEAEASRQAYIQLPVEQRSALLRFLNSL